jgi:hypothetical protein
VSDPTMLDANGKPLKRGDRVERRILSGHWNQDVVRGFRWGARRGWEVHTTAMPGLPTAAGAAYNSWQCPDLRVLSGSPGGAP